MNRLSLTRAHAALMVAAFVVAGFFVDVPGSTLSFQCRSVAGQSSECVYMAAISHAAIILSLVVLFVWRCTIFVTGADWEKPVGAMQRLAAFYIDFFVVFALSAPVAVFALVLEWLGTGTWSWEVVRSETSALDGLLSFAGVLVLFWVFVTVLSRQARAGRPTFGQFVAGYRVTRGDDVVRPPQYVARVFYSFIGMCMWPISLYKALRHERRAFWWDEATNTKVVRAEPFKHL